MECVKKTLALTIGSRVELFGALKWVKIGEKTVRRYRVRGGNYKFKALKLDSGNFSWPSEQVTRKSKVQSVVYNASNNELVRTNTLVKSSIIQIDATPFKQWYLRHYGTELGKKKIKEEGAAEVKQSRHLKAEIAGRQKERFIDHHVEEQFNQGRLLARITSRPGQSGRCDGYVLEGKELDFYLKKLDKKSKN